MSIRIVRVVPLVDEPCRYCIDGYIPAGTATISGPVYERCPYCQQTGAIPTCPGCDGTAYFPAVFSCLHCFALHCADQGYQVVICNGCTGVLDLIPLNLGRSEEGEDQP